ncbi:MAG: nucleotidyltransferase domain-containing protein [Bacilli bacterium]|nr:nucleotidyltransferase domain-containing protein [Bacilli bacterium]
MRDIQKLRKELGITQTQAANLCGVSRRTYQTYEETSVKNDTYEHLYNTLKEMGIFDGTNVVYGKRYIKQKCEEVFSKYPEVKCAYLFGSYARNQATKDSDIDILVVCPPTGMRFYQLAAELEDVLKKPVDLQTHRQVVESEDFLENLLTEGIKIYG